jgi:parvulin-like peptidyl-prolyl isomerase
VKDSNKGSEKSGTQGGSRSSSRSGSARGGSRSAAQRARHSEAPALNVVQVVILVVVVALIVGGVAGFAIYRDRVKPLQTKVLIVDDLSVEMRYFLRRVRMVGREPLEVLQLLTRELIITQVAVKPPYSIEVTDRDIEDYMRASAAGGAGDSITDAEVKEWYRQTLNDSELNDAEFRELMRRNLLSLGMTEYLGERMPTVVEQVRLYMIVFASPEAGTGVVARLEAGADFFELARSEANADERLRAKGGDLGWLPREAMRPELAAVFDLPVGQPSRLLALGSEAFGVAMVGERANAREMEPEAREAAKATALTTWFNQEYQYHSVEFHGFSNGYDSETDLWVKWQLQRMARHDNNPEDAR